MKKIFTFFLLVPCSLFAATFTVSTSNDDGAGSLRQAIIDANASPGAPHVINITVTTPIVLQSNLPALTKNTAINGASPGSIISGNNLYRIFQAVGTSENLISVELRRLTLQNGFLNVTTGLAGGAAFYGDYLGTLLIEDCHFENDTTRVETTDDFKELRGGACYIGGPGSIPNNSTAVIRRSTFSGNAAILSSNKTATVSGGALYTITLTDTIENCTFTNNLASGRSVAADGSITAGGAGIAFYGSSINFVNCTIVNNTDVGQQAAGGPVDSLGAGVRIVKYAFATYFKNSIVDKNTGGHTPNIYPNGFVSQGNNVIGSIGSVPPANFIASDTINTDSKIMALANNGGITPTCAIPSDSPAFDKVTSGTAPSADQRGFARSGAPDAGAYELNGTAFPLQLLTFAGSLKQRTVQLNWQTANEINVSHFIIERSTDGRRFDVIGNKEATGTQQADKHYEFTDAQPLNGTNYYRLKMVDLDGKFTYSAFVPIVLKQQLALSIYPNPVSEKLTISTSINATEAKVYNLSGQLVLRVKLTNGNKEIDVRHLSKGSYKLQVLDNGLNIAISGFTKL